MEQNIRNTTRARATIDASSRGYFVNEEGQVITPKGKTRTPGIDHKGYKHFSYIFRTEGKSIHTTIKYHQLAAFQKFGLQAMLEGILVRHKDDNPSNNRPNNLLIGTHQDNTDDKSPETLARSAIKISRSKRALTDQQVYDLREDRSNGMTYKKLSEKYRIVQASCHSIVNGNSYKDLPIIKKFKKPCR